MPSFLHAADVHLDSPLQGLERYDGAPVGEIREAARRALINLVEAAIERQVAFVVLAGDLYDGDWKDYRTGLFFNAQMSRLREGDIEVYVVAGNHDAASQITKQLRPPENVHFFPTGKPTTMAKDELGVALHGQGFPSRAVKDDLSAAYPDPIPGLLNVGILHTSVDGREGHEPYAPCTLARLRNRGYQYWALGHVHKREVLSEDPWVVFPGNLQGRNVRETGPKGASLVQYEGDEILEVEALELDVLRWARVSVDAREATTADDVIESARRSLEQSLAECDGRPLAVRVRVVGATSAHGDLVRSSERLMNEIRAQATDLGDVWVEKVQFRTRPMTDLSELRDREDAVGALVRAVDDLEEDPAAIEHFSKELDELRTSLPAGVVEGPEVPPAGDPEAVRAAVIAAKEYLLAHLIEGGGA